jgi:HSP20 family protein
MDMEHQNPMQDIDSPINEGGDIEAELARTSLRTTVPRPTARPVFHDDPKNESEGWLTVDVYQTPGEIVVESAVAGVNPDELDIIATPDSVSIKGERRREKEVRKDDYLHQECYWGRFSRSIILPQEVDPEAAEVHFRNGILTIHLPKATRQKSKRLKVERKSV